jgi:transcriptional regulator with XRE-family HTH domain
MSNAEPQQWLSLSGICDKLRLSPYQVKTLAKKGCLAIIKGKTRVADRFLEPTPEYREQLRLGAIIHQRHFPVPAGLSEKALLTQAECAELLGMTQPMMSRYMKQYAAPSIRVDPVHYLYSPMVVREAMLKRRDGGRYWQDKKTISAQKSPFLIPELVEFFRSRLSEEVSGIPTDKEFLADESIQKRLSMIVTQSQKADFAQKVKLAQEILQILESVKEPATSRSSS